MNILNKEILITGGTGSLGKTLVKLLIKDGHSPRGIRILSRDELKQWQMAGEIKEFQRAHGTEIPIAYIIGDVRNYDCLYRAFENVDIVINTAALKQVPACETNPLEAVMTNINGPANVIKAALARHVKKVMHVSTDKAVHAVNLYGATKAVGEKMMIHANVYSGRSQVAFSCCRYGNVLASRGSVVHIFRECVQHRKPMPLTHPDMTRFWTSLPRVGRFLLDRVSEMKGGEIFIPSMDMLHTKKMAEYLWQAAYGNDEIMWDEIGIRSGEKLHECLIAPEECFIEESVAPLNLTSGELGDFIHFYSIVTKGTDEEHENLGKPLYSNSPKNHKLSPKEFLALLHEEV